MGALTPYTEGLKAYSQESQDGQTTSSVSKNLGIGNTNLLYRWKAELVTEGGPVAETLDAEVRELRDELQRTKRERDILKKALAIFSQQE